MNLSLPEKIAFDAYGELFVVDGQNDRVLEYTLPLKAGMNATAALGQVNLSAHVPATNQSSLWEPDGIAFDSRGDLWVADTTNNRVLEFERPFKTGMKASLVLGQPTFQNRTPATADVGMHDPAGLAFDAAGDLFVADRANDRVLEFRPPFTSDQAASVVLGQSSPTTSGAGTSATNLSLPTGVAVSPTGDLWVADTENSRVLEFEPSGTSGFVTGSAAALVLGQRNFATTTEGLPYGMSAPWDVAFDAVGDLWVADAGTPNRIVEYLPPFVANETPSVAIGQASFTGSSAGTSSTLLEHPRGLAFDPSDDLWVSDTGNCRVLEFAPPSFAVDFAATGLASGTTWSVTFDGLYAATNNGWITFPARNGSYGFSAGSVGGYTDSPSTGTVVVNGSSVSLGIAYTATILGLPPSVFWPLLVALLVLIAVVEAVLLERRRRKRMRPLVPSPPSEGAPAAPPGRPPPPSAP
jgi:sugar lactone lactonase YvrE